MAELELIDGSGWILNVKNLPKKCNTCREKLEIPFYWCNENKIAFCSINCQKKEGLCTQSRFREHEHFNIIQIQKQKQNNED